MASSDAEKRGQLILYDAMALPRREVTLIADLLEEGMFTRTPVGGVVLLFLHEGRPVGQAMTGGDGRGMKAFVPHTLGESRISVHLVESRRVTAPEATAKLFVWSKGRTILLISLPALMQRPSGFAPLFGSEKKRPDVESGAIDALARLHRQASLIYMIAGDRGELSELRQWMAQQKCPSGPLMLLSSGVQALAHLLEGWRRAGWNNIRGAVAGSPDEAKTLLAKGIATVAPPSTTREKWPDKVMKPRNWSEVAQRLAKA